MNILKKIVFFNILLSVFLTPHSINANDISIPIENYINDYAHILSQETEDTLNQLGSQLEKETGAQVVFITTNSLKGQDIRQVAYQTFKTYQLGSQEKDNGVLFIVSLEEKQRYMEVGTGLESTLTDIQSQHLQQDFLVPYFQQGEYEQGIINLYQETTLFINEYDEDVQKADEQEKTNILFSSTLLPIGLILLMMFIYAFSHQRQSVKGIYLRVHQRYQLHIRDYDFEKETILISSENENIVSVQADGWIEAHQVGQTTIKIQKLTDTDPFRIPVIVQNHSHPTRYDNDDILDYLIWGSILTPRSGFRHTSSGQNSFGGFSGGGGSSRGGGAGGSW